MARGPRVGSYSESSSRRQLHESSASGRSTGDRCDAGPNGAGKSTFYEAYVARAGLRLVNADDLARAFGIDPYEAAQRASDLRSLLMSQRERFLCANSVAPIA